MKKQLIDDLGDRVICDYCNKEWTDSDKSGGFIFGGHAICPDCAPASMERIKRYGEQWNIKATCPKDMSFKDFVVNYRGENNKVILITLEEGESLSDVYNPDK